MLRVFIDACSVPVAEAEITRLVGSRAPAAAAAEP
jgi:hypothetical protein